MPRVLRHLGIGAFAIGVVSPFLVIGTSKIYEFIYFALFDYAWWLARFAEKSPYHACKLAGRSVLLTCVATGTFGAWLAIQEKRDEKKDE
jgi:hypothetical protein